MSILHGRSTKNHMTAQSIFEEVLILWEIEAVDALLDSFCDNNDYIFVWFEASAFCSLRINEDGVCLYHECLDS